MYTMCIHYVTKLFTLVYAFYERKPECKPIKRKPECTLESHWGQWSVIDEN
jgi:hypothetical protein